MISQRIKINSIKNWLPCTTILLCQRSTPIRALSLALLVGNREKMPSSSGNSSRSDEEGFSPTRRILRNYPTRRAFFPNSLLVVHTWDEFRVQNQYSGKKYRPYWFCTLNSSHVCRDPGCYYTYYNYQLTKLKLCWF